MVQQTVDVDLKLIDYLDQQLNALELTLVRQAKAHDAHAFHLLRSVPRIGKILALLGGRHTSWATWSWSPTAGGGYSFTSLI